MAPLDSLNKSTAGFAQRETRSHEEISVFHVRSDAVHRGGNGAEHIVFGSEFKLNTFDDAAAIVNPDIAGPGHFAQHQPDIKHHNRSADS